jgi:hypothetical protein
MIVTSSRLAAWRAFDVKAVLFALKLLLPDLRNVVQQATRLQVSAVFVL